MERPVAVAVVDGNVTHRERSELMRAGARAILLKEIGSGALVQTIRGSAARLGANERRSEA